MFLFVKAMEKERVDEMTEVAHYTTKKQAPSANEKGRKKVAAKIQRAETRPAPNGQRIEPVIDPAFVKRVNEELLKKNRVRKLFLSHRKFSKTFFHGIFFRKKKRSSTRKRLSNSWLKKASVPKKSLKSCEFAAKKRRKSSQRRVNFHDENLCFVLLFHAKLCSTLKQRYKSVEKYRC